MEVALGGGQLGVAKERLDPPWVTLAGDHRAGAVTERVEAQHAQPGRCRGALEAAAQRRTVEGAPEARAEHQIVGTDDLGPAGEARERLRRRIGDRDIPGLPALRRTLRLVA